MASSARILSYVTRAKFGPNSRQVEAFLKALGGLSPKQWERIQETAPPAGSVPELEVVISPGYFRAAEAAVGAAKGEVFPGSETAYFDAMRQAHEQASMAAQKLMPEPMTEASHESQRSVEGDPEAITQLMSDAFAGETWQRAASAAMLAAGALVIRDWLPPPLFSTLYDPVASVVPTD